MIVVHEGISVEELVKSAALRLLEDDARFRACVRKGIEQAERGEFIEEEEMDARVKHLLKNGVQVFDLPPDSPIVTTEKVRQLDADEK